MHKLGGGALLLVALALQPAFAAAPPPPELEIQFKNELGASYVPVQARAWLNGDLLFDLTGDVARPVSGVAPLHNGTTSTGVHAVSMHFIYEGRSPVFGYVSRYRFHMRARATVDMRPGRGLQIVLHAFERGGMAMPWENRPDFKVTGTPKEALIDVEALPIEKGEMRPEGTPVAAKTPGSPAPPEKTQAELDALGESAVQAVLEEAEQVKARKAGVTAEPVPAVADAEAPSNVKLATARVPGAKPASAPTDPASCTFPSVRFGLAQFSLGPRSQKGLRAYARCIKRAEATDHVRIVGHCDARGSAGYNQQLGQWRAEAVARFLTRHGLSPDRLETASQGKDRLLCEESTQRCHARNRRVELEPVGDTTVASPGPL